MANIFDAMKRAIVGLLPGRPVTPMKEAIEITCVLCGSAFIWTADEQRLFATKGYSTPSRCRPCRAWRRAPRATRGPAPGTEINAVTVCNSCQRPFTISPKRRQWLAAQGHTLPKRCNICRKTPRPRPIDQLKAEVEALHTEWVLTGNPLSDAAAVALEGGDVTALRAVLSQAALIEHRR